MLCELWWVETRVTATAREITTWKLSDHPGASEARAAARLHGPGIYQIWTKFGERVAAFRVREKVAA